MYIYENPDWPHFVWDQEIITSYLTQIRYRQGRFIGGMDLANFHLRELTNLETLTQDVLKSSEIEGEILDQSLVHSSIARHLGMETAALDKEDKNTEGVVEMILDATQRFYKPLDAERLFQWHASLFPTGRSGWKKICVGVWRKGSVQVFSRSMDKEKVHFEAPSADYVKNEMDFFLDWLNRETTMDLVLKAAIAHFWFLTIHPFDDGNGRIGRAIADFLLARSENSSHRFYSLSTQIQKERKSYYEILEKSQKGSLDITPWISWFLNCLKQAIENACHTLDRIKSKNQAWEIFNKLSLNERQIKMINLLLDKQFEGKLTSSKWAKITKCSQDSALRDIHDLISKGILMKNLDEGRNTNYLLIENFEL